MNSKDRKSKTSSPKTPQDFHGVTRFSWPEAWVSFSRGLKNQYHGLLEFSCFSRYFRGQMVFSHVQITVFHGMSRRMRKQNSMRSIESGFWYLSRLFKAIPPTTYKDLFTCALEEVFLGQGLTMWFLHTFRQFHVLSLKGLDIKERLLSSILTSWTPGVSFL